MKLVQIHHTWSKRHQAIADGLSQPPIQAANRFKTERKVWLDFLCRIVAYLGSYSAADGRASNRSSWAHNRSDHRSGEEVAPLVEAIKRNDGWAHLDGIAPARIFVGMGTGKIWANEDEWLAAAYRCKRWLARRLGC